MFVISIVSAIVPLLSTVTLGVLVSRFVKTNNNEGGLAFWLTITISLFLTRSVLEEIGKYLRCVLSDELSLCVQKKLYYHANLLPLAFFENHNSLDHLFRVRSGGGVSGILTPVDSAIGFTAGSLQAAFLFGLMIWYAPLPGFLLTVAVIPMLALQWYTIKQKYLLEIRTTQNRRWGNYFTSILTQPATLIPVRMLGLAGLLLERFAEKIQKINQEKAKLYCRRAQLDVIAEVFFFVIFGAILAWMFYMKDAGNLSTTGLVIFGVAAFRAKLSTARVINSAVNALNSSYTVNFIIDFLKIPVGDNLNGSTGVNTQNSFDSVSIKVKNITFVYENTEKNVLENIDFEIQAGQKIAIVGTNGAGKSTLIKLLCRLYSPQKGEIQFNETDISLLNTREINEMMSVVTQNPIRFEGTVRENIALGNWKGFNKKDDNAIYSLLEKVKLADFVRSLPDGLDTLLGKKFGNHTMSGGQWQRLAIARILTRPTPILILDEPTANLDAIAEQEIFNILCNYNKKQTMIFVTHRFSTVKMVDRIIVFENGCLVEEGAHNELLRQNGIYTAMYNAYHC